MIQSVLGVSAASVLPLPLFPQEVAENPKLPVSAADAVADAAPRFFDRESFQALRHLGEILVPARQNLPGGVEAEAAEFLDFLIGQSPADRQTLYRDGVAQLNAQAQSRYGKPFAEVSVADADSILAPLHENWTYQGPADPFARFLRAAKEDFLKATVNSRQWAMAASGRSRSASGLNTYWFPIE
jgi:gluconate 2-dehydrogenase subunit 3-like protein